MGETPSALADLARAHAQFFVEWDRAPVFHGHVVGHGKNLAQLVELAHGIVKDGRDDSAVAMPGRTGVTLTQAEVAHKAVTAVIKTKLQSHAFAIVLSASEAEILFDGQGLRQMTVRWFAHKGEF